MKETTTIGDAIAIATNWIASSELPFSSAFIGGSVAYTDPDSLYDPASDIDCYLVVEGDPPDGKIGKITVEGALLDVSWLPWNQLQQARSHAVLASLLHFGQIVTDRSGQLTDLKHTIDTTFTSPEAIATRLEDMRARIRPLATPTNQAQLSAPEQVMNWLFPATLATHIPLIRACAPLTVRKRFIAAKKVMDPADYEELLKLYGFDVVTKEQAQSCLDDTAALFDHVAPLAAESARFWASDITADSRDISIGGSQQLIDARNHREALYWIIATRTRCLTVLDDAGKDTCPFMRSFNDMTLALGICTAPQRMVRTSAILEWIEK